MRPAFLVCLNTLAYNLAALSYSQQKKALRPMVYFSRRQCSNPDDCAETPSPTVEKVLQTMAPSSAPDDHKLLRAYIVLALNLILFAVLARAGYRALMRPRAPPATKHHRRNSSLTMEKMMDGIEGSDRGSRDSDVRRRSVTKPE